MGLNLVILILILPLKEEHKTVGLADLRRLINKFVNLKAFETFLKILIRLYKLTVTTILGGYTVHQFLSIKIPAILLPLNPNLYFIDKIKKGEF